MMECPKVAIFDLDDTIAESFKAPTLATIENLKELLDRIPVAIMTGRDFSRIEPDFLPHMTNAARIDRFFLFPESTAQCFQWQNDIWHEIYGLSITDEDRKRIHEAVESAIVETGALKGLPQFGDHYVEKRSQTAFACLGMGIPSDLKYSWDPGNKIRKKLQQAIEKKLPDYDVLLGGATTIDITKKGVNKSYGISWLSEQLHIPAQQMLYVGDALYEDGNDSVVIPTGIRTIAVKGPEETKLVIAELLAACAA